MSPSCLEDALARNDLSRAIRLIDNELEMVIESDRKLVLLNNKAGILLKFNTIDKTEESLVVAQGAITMNSGDKKSHFRVMQALMQLQRFPEAHAAALHAIRRFGRHPDFERVAKLSSGVDPLANELRAQAAHVPYAAAAQNHQRRPTTITDGHSPDETLKRAIAILGMNVPQTFLSRQEARKAYKKKLLQLHPDRGGGRRIQEFLQLQDAYKTIENLLARRDL